jgi:hypothetical protein
MLNCLAAAIPAGDRMVSASRTIVGKAGAVECHDLLTPGSAASVEGAYLNRCPEGRAPARRRTGSR